VANATSLALLQCAGEGQRYGNVQCLLAAFLGFNERLIIVIHIESPSKTSKVRNRCIASAHILKLIAGFGVVGWHSFS
jgi:hypothetical protein